jgi:putative hydrolase of the HAD superfamily
MTIKAVIFDMGGTLERVSYTAVGRLKVMPEMNQCLLKNGIDLHLGGEELFKVIIGGYGKYHKWCVDSMVELTPYKVWSEYIFEGYSVDAGNLEAASEELMYFLEDRFFERVFRPEVPSVLEAIQQQNLKIGLISNICCRNLVPVNLKKYGISQYFDPIVLSSEFGRRKPDPAIFHYAAQLANLPANECVYVGDRIARDIVGARLAGFSHAVQIINDFDHGEEDLGGEPDAVFHHMSELLDFLNEASKI